MIAGFVLMAAAAQADAGAAPKMPSCPSADPAQVIVCGKAPGRYRIDPNVLEASRAVDGLPAKPPLRGDEALADHGCVGPNVCGGGVIPLVGMAVVAAKAVALAAQGDDWRDAIRIHEDEYRLYKQAEARRASERKPHIGLEFSNSPTGPIRH